MLSFLEIHEKWYNFDSCVEIYGEEINPFIFVLVYYYYLFYCAMAQIANSWNTF